MYPFERFSDNAKHVLTLAQQEAETAGHTWIGTEHMLLALIREENGLAGACLKRLDVDYESAKEQLSAILEGQPKNVLQQILPTSRVKRIIEMAFDEAFHEKSHVVETGHILVAILREGNGVAAHVLDDRGISLEKVRDEIGRLKAEGGAQESKTGSGPKIRLCHLEVSDSKGRPILVDIHLPIEYSTAEESAVTTRIRQAIEGRKA